MSRIEQLAEGVTLYLGDCREILPTIEGVPKWFDLSRRRIEAALKQPDFFVPTHKPAKQEALEL